MKYSLLILIFFISVNCLDAQKLSFTIKLKVNNSFIYEPESVELVFELQKEGLSILKNTYPFIQSRLPVKYLVDFYLQASFIECNYGIDLYKDYDSKMWDEEIVKMQNLITKNITSKWTMNIYLKEKKSKKILQKGVIDNFSDVVPCELFPISSQEILLTDIRDGQKYQLFKVGHYKWMTMNMKHGHEIYKTFHSFETSQNACPDGWWIPDLCDWRYLLWYFGDSKINSTSITHCSSALETLKELALNIEIEDDAWTYDLSDDTMIIYFPSTYWLGDEGQVIDFRYLQKRLYIKENEDRGTNKKVKVSYPCRCVTISK